jgi:hypothetical protein
MGQFVTKIKVKCDFDNSLDKNFVFTLVTDGTEEDVTKTVNQALRQKIAEGEMESQNLRGVEIKSDDERGFFGTFVVKNLSDFISSL